MCGCVVILVILLVGQLYLISCGRGFRMDPFTNVNNPTRWKIDPITGLKMNADTVHSQTFPIITKKLAVPKSWDDNSRHVR